MAARKRTQPAVEEIEEVEGPEAEPAGGTLEMTLIVVTTVALLAGIIAGLAELGSHYATGPLAG